MFAIVAFLIIGFIIVGLVSGTVKLLNKIGKETQANIIFWSLAIMFGAVVVLWIAVGITELYRAII